MTKEIENKINNLVLKLHCAVCPKRHYMHCIKNKTLYSGCEDANYTQNVLKEELTKTFKELSTLQDQLRWISVEEELPPIGDSVLCKFVLGSMQPKIEYRISHLRGSGKFLQESDWIRVIEWLPIPRKEEK